MKGKKETSVYLHEDAFLEALCVCLSVQALGVGRAEGEG